MYYGDKREAKVNIMSELVNRGWKVFGFTADDSDSMTDYYSPAHWDGIAEKNGYVLVIDNNGTYYSGYEIKSYNYNKSAYAANDRIKKLTAMMNDPASTENEKASCATLIEKEEEKAGVNPTYTVKETYPTFQHGNPKSCSFHIEKDGQIIDKGTGVFACHVCNDHYEPNKSERISKVNAFVDRVEAAIKNDSALESEVIKVPKTVIKPVEIDTKVLTANQVNDDTYFIMKVGYTGGISKGTMFKCERASTIANSDSFVFAKLGKNLKPSKARGNTWYQSITDLNNKLTKGHIAIVEMQEFIEWESKTVYKKTAKKQKANFDVEAIAGDVEEVTEEVKTETVNNNVNNGNQDVKISFNKEKNGIEIKFTVKPSQNVITALKENGFRWFQPLGFWCAKQTEERLKFAQSLCNNVAEEQQAEEQQTAQEAYNSAQEINPDELMVEILADSLTSYIITIGKPQTDKEKEAANKHILSYMVSREVEPTEGMLAYMQNEYPFMYSIVTHNSKAQTEPQKLTAYEYGVKAFNNGISCAPALDGEFLEAHIKGLKVGEGAAELMKEWLNGWTKANLDAPFNFDNNSDITEQPQDPYAYNIDPAFTYHDIHFKAWNMEIETLEEYLTVFEIPFYVSGDKFICKGITTEHVKMVEEINIQNKAIIFYDNKYNDNSNNSQQAEEPQPEEQKEVITEPIIINGKIKVKEITFEWSESSMIKDNLTVSTFAEAEEAVRLIASNVTGGYDKTKFTITWTDGDTYTGRLDVEKEDASKKTPIKDHITDWLLFLTGDNRPSHMSEKQYQAHIVKDEEEKQQYYEFFEKYALTDMEPTDYNSEAKPEPDNVVYHDFGNVESQEEEKETETVNTFDDDIFSKFDKVEVTTESKIAAIDLEFCQEQESIYKKLIDTYTSFNNQLQEIAAIDKDLCNKFSYTINEYTHKHDTAFYYSWKSSDVNATIEKMKNRFINTVCYYFMKKYSVTINYEKIQKKYDSNVTYENIIDEIYIQLDGHNFTEKAEQEIKEKAKDAVRNSDKITIKNNKIIIDGWFSHHDSIWKEHKLSGQYLEIFKALQHFDNGSTSGSDELKERYSKERSEANYERYEPKTMNKIKSIKFLKNGKLEIEFTSNQLAAKFAKEYCGYNQKSA